MGFEAAMEVQAVTLPLARARKDLMVQSRTGSGKTAAFGIPFVNDIVDPEAKVVQALVLLPTRELALQVAAELARIAVHRPITVAPIYGGAPMGRQVEMLRAGAQIVCGTPGRILDHLRRGTLSLKGVRCAVLDECDEMLSMGFQEDIEHILEQTPESRQTLLFSATVPEGIQRLSRRFLKNPEFLKLSADFVGVHEIRHVYYSIPGINREQELLRILNFEDPKTAIIFCNTREETSRVADFLQKQGFEAEAISSDLSQIDRERVMTRMRAGQIRFLVATDVAARGIDIEGAVARLQLHVSRGARNLHSPHGANGPRRQARHGHLAHRADGSGIVLLPETALQDPPRGARVAVGGGDSLAPGGRARPSVAPGARGRSRGRMAGLGATDRRRDRWRAFGRGPAGPLLLVAADDAGCRRAARQARLRRCPQHAPRRPSEPRSDRPGPIARGGPCPLPW